MAKGNDGNFLQHALEAETAHYLMWKARRRRLHLVLTHGMKPFERLDQPIFPPRPPRPVNTPCRKLRKALERGVNDDRPSCLAVHHAYRALIPQLHRNLLYPNSAEIIAALVGLRAEVSGIICETRRSKYNALRRSWRRLALRPRRGSWRTFARTRRLMPPTTLDRPWMISLDPFTWKTASIADDANLSEADLDLLVETVCAYVSHGQPGAVVVCSYALSKSSGTLDAFKRAVRKLVGAVRRKSGKALKVRFSEIRGGWGTFHVGALLSTDGKLLSHVREMTSRVLR